MQAAFRAQNPCLFHYGQQQFRKENAYVFDFDPARTLVIFEQFANDLSSTTSAGKGSIDERKQHIRELINFFPVYGEDDDGEMITLDAEKVLTIPRKIHAQEVVRKGFMCNFLFQNISNIFNAPQEVIDIIHNFEPQKEPVIITPETKNELSINDEGNIEISENIIIGKADNIFGPKIYEEAKEELIEAVETIAKENQDKKEPDAIIEKMKEKFGEVANSLINTAQDSYGKDLSKSTKKALQRELDRKANAIIATQCTKHIIEQNVIERNRKKELEEASSTTEKEQINHKFDKEKLASQDKFLEEMKTAIEELPKTFGETVVKAVETDSKQREKNSIEDGVRDHLRGFSRTIPSFLMAYGNENTTLENFDTIIPDEVFKEVTSISLEEFRFLRDGGDYVDEQAGETKHFEGQLFDPVVFNDSVKEFLSLKTKLGNYFDENQTEDIFDYIPPQKTNQIYTPKKVVIEMVDMLEQENPNCFDDENKTFIDLYMKSGLYITEIVKRLYRSEKLKKLYPDRIERLKHIFEKQVYGLAPTEIIYRIAIAFILGFDDTILIKKHNLQQFDTLPSVQAGTLETDLDEVFG